VFVAVRAIPDLTVQLDAIWVRRGLITRNAYSQNVSGCGPTEFTCGLDLLEGYQ
jgi:hypothetical protein